MEVFGNGISVNEAGHLTLGGADAVSLAREYGTPLYLMDETVLRQNCRDFKNSIDRYYDGNGLVCYASKAFSCKEIYRIVKEEGLGTDVVSGGELATALSVDFPADRICFHGNNKTTEELTMALKAGVGRIVADHIGELQTIGALAAKLGVTARVMLRIKPGVDAHTHDFVRTGQIDSKFGFALETGEALAAVKAALATPGLTLCGLHCHIGSQILDIEPFVHTAEVMLGFMAQVKRETGYTLSDLNLGGGFGIRYTEEDDAPPYQDYMEAVSQAVRAKAAELDLPVPFILIEPGRAIAAPAGVTLYTVGALKEIPNIRTYLSVDGGMTDNPRYILYQSRYEFVIANKATEPKTATVTVAGRCCESGDLLGEHLPLQKAETGDILAVLATGAYNYSMASNYNRVPRPPVVMVKDATPRLIVRGESFSDMYRNDI